MIDLSIDKALYEPDEILRARLCADGLLSAKTAELRLLWFTQGKGTQDIGLIQTMEIPRSSASFTGEFRLPRGPVSFRGQLITLTWAVEAIIDQEFERKEFVLSPFGREIDIISLQTAGGR